MYQIASLYGIARTLGRVPYFDANTQNLYANLVEWAETFPNLICNLRVLVGYGVHILQSLQAVHTMSSLFKAPKHVKHVDFGRGNYVDPSR